MSPAQRGDAMPSEAKYAIASLVLLVVVTFIPGGRVLVLPVLFLLLLVLLFWAAKPGSED